MDQTALNLNYFTSVPFTLWLLKANLITDYTSYIVYVYDNVKIYLQDLSNLGLIDGTVALHSDSDICEIRNYRFLTKLHVETKGLIMSLGHST